MKTKQVKYVVRTMWRSRWSNAVKILSVSLGILMSALLFLGVAYNRSFDRCFRDSDRLYAVWTTLNYDNGITSGAVQASVGKLGEAMLTDMADVVESATTWGIDMGGFPLHYGGNEFKAHRFGADSLYFETMGMTVLSGNPRIDMQGTDVIYLSDKLAQQMFGEEDPIGKTVSDGNWDMTVRGVFRALPANTTHRADAVISLPTILARYNGGRVPFDWDTPYVFSTMFRTKDAKVDAGTLQARIANIMHSRRGSDVSWEIEPDVRLLRDTYFSREEVRSTSAIMLALAATILFVTIMNYILITLASLSRRSKAIGVQKCCGASDGSVFGLFMIETAIVVLISLVLTGGIVLYAREFIEQALLMKVSALFAMERIWVTAGVVLIIFLAGGVIPGRIFTRIHVTTVFRRFSDHRRGWKRALLAAEFAAVAFIFGVMCVIIKQYSALMDADTGYDPQMIAVGPNPASSKAGSDAMLAFFRSMPYVESVTSADYNPASGFHEAIYTDGAGRELFAYGSESARGNYADVMSLDIVSGRAPECSGEVMVSESFASKAWPGENPVGMSYDDYGGRKVVTGVYKDLALVNFYQEPQPTAIGWQPSCGPNVYVKLKEPFAEHLRMLNEDAHSAYPKGCPADSFVSLADMNRMWYVRVKAFRNLAILLWLSITVITLMGLIGYIGDEIQRRSKEIVIRKVNGATAADIVRLVCRGVACTAIPAVVAGGVAAWYVGYVWLRTFVLRVDYGMMIAAVETVLIAMICISAALQTLRAANENPVRKLKYE